ncbi:unnamed protein product [Urochloa humidicola]
MSCSSSAFPFPGGNSVVKYQFPVKWLIIEQCYDSGKELTQLLTYFPEVTHLVLDNFYKVNEKIRGLGVVGQEVTATHGPSSSANKVDKAQMEQEEIVALAAKELLILPPQLQILKLSKYPELSLCSYPLNDNSKEDRSTREGGGLQGLNSLEWLVIEDCPKLLSSYSESPPFPGFPFPNSLKHLEIEGPLGIKTLVPLSNLSSLTSLSIDKCGDLKSKGLFSLLAQGHLTKLIVTNTPGFFVDSEPTQQSQDNDHEFPFCSSKLQDLKTDDVVGATCTPMRTLLFSSLKTLEIFGDNAEMLDFTEQQLQFISSLEAEHISFVSCSRLKYVPAWLHTLPKLKRLRISDCGDIQMLAKDKLPSSLQELIIQSCPNIQLLPKDCLPSSLQRLKINSCPAIQSLPKEKDFPSSLQELDVSGSGTGKLKKQCRKLIGIVPIVKV